MGAALVVLIGAALLAVDSNRGAEPGTVAASRGEASAAADEGNGASGAVRAPASGSSRTVAEPDVTAPRDDADESEQGAVEPARVAGFLLDLEGQPIVDGTAALVGEDDPALQRVRTTRTDEDGAFAFERLEPGSWELCFATQPEFGRPPAMVTLEVLSLEAGEEVSSIFYVPRGRTLRGVATYDWGFLDEGGAVLVLELRNLAEPQRVVARTQTWTFGRDELPEPGVYDVVPEDERDEPETVPAFGRFEFTGLEPGLYRLDVLWDPFGGYGEFYEVDLLDGDVELEPIRLARFRGEGVLVMPPDVIYAEDWERR